MNDIIIPNNNEAEFIAMATWLGYSNLSFLYDPMVDIEQKKIDISATLGQNLTMECGYIVNEKNAHYALKKIKEKTLVVSYYDEPMRNLIEEKQVDIVFGFESIRKKDSLHQRSSGLNHVIAKQMHDNGIACGFSFSDILHAHNKDILLGRMMQNIRLCRKFKVAMAAASCAQHPFEMRSAADMMNFFGMLGMNNSDFKTIL